MQYQYVAYTLQEGLVKGKVDAPNEAIAREELEQQGYKPISIKPPPKFDISKYMPELEQVKASELPGFAKTCATMLSSGANLLRVLEMLQSEGSSRAMKKVLARIYEKVSAGDSFTSALREHPKIFDEVFISLVEVGEYTGGLAGALQQLASIMERAAEAKAKVMKAMMMPMFLIGSSAAMLGFMVFVAFPPLLETFESMDVALHPLAAALIGGTMALKDNAVYIVAVVVVVIAVNKFLQRFPTAKYWIHYSKVKLPLLGPLVVASDLGKFSRVMGALLNAGVDLPSALRLAKGTSKNAAIRAAWEAADESMINGHRMSEALLRHKILPEMFVELLAIGEDSNTLPKTMSEIADAYEKQFEERVEKMIAITEPLSTLAVGALVLMMMLSVMLPILEAAGKAKTGL